MVRDTLLTATTEAKTWVDFAFYVFDAIKGYILPVIGGALAGWFIPSPLKRKAKPE